METNPGPRKLKYPCQICHLACRWGQCAVRCDSCELWYHKDCMMMGSGVFSYLNKSEASWVCCNCGLPNFNSSFFSDDDFTHPNPFSPLNGSHSLLNEYNIDAVPIATSSPKNSSCPSGAESSSYRLSRQNSGPSRAFKVVVMNCQSVKNKIKEFENLIESTNPDIILVTESWLNSSILDGEVVPENYSLIRKDRSSGKGGGVFIAYRNDIILTHRPDLSTDCELVWAQVQVKGAKSVLIGCYYRPPDDGDSLQQLHASLCRISQSPGSADIWLGGDFNLGDINWSTGSVAQYSNKGMLCRKLLDIVTDFSLSQVITEPTHHLENSKSLLDLFLTSNPTMVNDIYHMPGLGLSKHDCLMIHMSIMPQRAKVMPRKVLMFRKMDTDGFTKDAELFCSIFLRLSLIPLSPFVQIFYFVF